MNAPTAPRPPRRAVLRLAAACGAGGLLELMLAAHAGGAAPDLVAGGALSLLVAGAMLVLGRNDGDGPGGGRPVPVRIRINDR